MRRAERRKMGRREEREKKEDGGSEGENKRER